MQLSALKRAKLNASVRIVIALYGNLITLNTMSKQTAVEWLVEKYELVGMLTPPMIERAKAMEKKQIVEAWHDGQYAYFDEESAIDFANGEDYYNHTYKGGEQ